MTEHQHTPRPRHRPANREDHDDFCRKEQWQLVRGATGQPVKHHRTYELRLWDNRVLRTRISRPIDRSEYARSTWAHILREQLEVIGDEFWDCLERDLLPNRGAPPEERPGLPYHLFRQLTETLGLPPEEAASLTPQQATARIAKYWTDYTSP